MSLRPRILKYWIRRGTKTDFVLRYRRGRIEIGGCIRDAEEMVEIIERYFKGKGPTLRQMRCKQTRIIYSRAVTRATFIGGIAKLFDTHMVEETHKIGRFLG